MCITAPMASTTKRRLDICSILLSDSFLFTTNAPPPFLQPGWPHLITILMIASVVASPGRATVWGSGMPYLAFFIITRHRTSLWLIKFRFNKNWSSKTVTFCLVFYNKLVELFTLFALWSELQFLFRPERLEKLRYLIIRFRTSGCTIEVYCHPF